MTNLVIPQVSAPQLNNLWISTLTILTTSSRSFVIVCFISAKELSLGASGRLPPIMLLVILPLAGICLYYIYSGTDGLVGCVS